MNGSGVTVNSNFFQRNLIPADSTLVRGAMRQAAHWSTHENPAARHIVSTAFAVAAVALSLFKTISYLLQLPVKILLNIVRLDPKALVFDFAESLSNATRSLLMGAFGATYVIGGMLFPEKVYGFFRPAFIQSLEEALEKRQLELETALAEIKSAEASADSFLKIAQENGRKVAAAEDQLRTALSAVEAEALRQEIEEARRSQQEALGQVARIRENAEAQVARLHEEFDAERGRVDTQLATQFRGRLQAALREQEQRLTAAFAREHDDNGVTELQTVHEAAIARVEQQCQDAQEALEAAQELFETQRQELQQLQAVNRQLAAQAAEFQVTGEALLEQRRQLHEAQQRNADMARRLDEVTGENATLRGRVEELEGLEGLRASAAMLAYAYPAPLPPGPVNEGLASSLVPTLSDSLPPGSILAAEVRVTAAEDLAATTVLVGGDSFVEMDLSEQRHVEEARQRIGFNGYANAMTYLYHFFASQSEAPADNIELSFNLETGRVEMRPDPQARANFCQILRETYGYNAASRAIKSHKLDQPGSLTFLEVKKALVGIAAHVKVNDLRALFHEVKAGNFTRVMGHLIAEDERAVITQFETFEEIPPHHAALHLLMRAYRTLPKPAGRGEVERVSLLQLLSVEAAPGQRFSGFNQYHHDLKLLLDAALPAVLERDGIATPIPDGLTLQEMGAAEHFAKGIGYREFFPGSIAPQFGGKLYELVGEIEHTGDAVYCRLYAGVNALNGKYDADNPLEVRLVTRGTQFKPSNQASGQSLARDFEFGGVGKGSFDARAAEIKELITNYLEKVPEGAPVHLRLEGHSLGATDSMRLTVLVAQLLAERPELRAKVLKVSVNPQNPPAIEPAVNEAFARALEQIGGEQELFNITYSLFDGDRVQWIAAGVYLGAGINSPLLRCRAVHLKPPVPLSALGIHGARPFTEQADLAFGVKIVDRGEALAQILEREHYQHPDSGAAGRFFGELQRAATASVFTVGHVLLVTPLMRTFTALGGMFLGRRVGDNALDGSAIYGKA